MLILHLERVPEAKDLLPNTTVLSSPLFHSLTMENQISMNSTAHLLQVNDILIDVPSERIQSAQYIVHVCTT